MIYLASSWRNGKYPFVADEFRARGFNIYDFRNPGGAPGFSWDQVGGAAFSREETAGEYLRMIQHPRAVEGFMTDMQALESASALVLILPCGKSAHLELGFAAGRGIPTAILLEDRVEPELMYRVAGLMTNDLSSLMEWLKGVL